MPLYRSAGPRHPLCLWLITTVPNYVLLIFAGYTAAMILLYFAYGMHNSELAKGHPVVADDETPYFPEDAALGPDGKPIVKP